MANTNLPVIMSPGFNGTNNGSLEADKADKADKADRADRADRAACDLLCEAKKTIEARCQCFKTLYACNFIIFTNKLECLSLPGLSRKV